MKVLGCPRRPASSGHVRHSCYNLSVKRYHYPRQKLSLNLRVTFTCVPHPVSSRGSNAVPDGTTARHPAAHPRLSGGAWRGTAASGDLRSLRCRPMLRLKLADELQDVALSFRQI